MSLISNIWNHPRTSTAGLLIAVVTIGGVLSQQGISLGTAGTGTVVTLVCAIASALLGCWRRIPRMQWLAGKRTGQTGSLGADCPAAAAAFDGGCSETTVAKDIVNWTPALQSAVVTVDSAAAVLAPADAPIFSAATTGLAPLQIC